MMKTPIYCPHCQRLVASVEMAKPPIISVDPIPDISDIASLPVKEVDWPQHCVRICNALQADNVNTVGELIRLPECEVRRIPNLGAASVQAIKAGLADLGLCLAGSP